MALLPGLSPPQLWHEYFRLELLYALRLRERRRVLGIGAGDDDGIVLGAGGQLQQGGVSWHPGGGCTKRRCYPTHCTHCTCSTVVAQRARRARAATRLLLLWQLC